MLGELGKAMVLQTVLKVQHESKQCTLEQYSCERAAPLNICLHFIVEYTLLYSM